MSTESLKQVLEGIEEIAKHVGRYDPPTLLNYLVVSLNAQADTLRQAIADLEKQEPVGQVIERNGELSVDLFPLAELRHMDRLYTHSLSKQCTRSHPHENMDELCELRTEIARLTNQLTEQKREQEPVAWKETHGKVIKALAGIVTVHTPDNLFDLDAIPRDPVMSLVQDIYAALDKYKPPQPNQQPAAMTQVYRCKIKSRKQIDREIPRDKQGWWADISAGQLIRLRQATKADLDRCTLNGAHSKDPEDYMCETHTNGSLVSKVALEYMNAEQNVFAAIGGTRPQPNQPLTDEQIDNIEFAGLATPKEKREFARAIEAAHGIKEKNT